MCDADASQVITPLPRASSLGSGRRRRSLGRSDGTPEGHEVPFGVDRDSRSPGSAEKSRLPLRVQTDDRLWRDAGFLSGPGETAIRLVYLPAFGAERTQRPPSLPIGRAARRPGDVPGLRVRSEGDAVNFGLVSPTPNDSWTHWVRTTGPCEGCDRESAGTRPLGRSPPPSLYCCRSRRLCQASNRNCHGW